MAKLTFKQDFTLEVGDETFAGTFKELTRKENKKFKDKYSGKEDIDEDILFKDRLAISVSGDDKKAIMAIGEEYNYKAVFETIIKDIREKQEGK